MSAVDLVFYLAAALVAVGALGVVYFSNVLYAAISLLFSLLGVAAIFGLLGADFVMAAQLIVYVGGILVLILFGVLLTTRIYEVKLRDRVFHPVVGSAAGLALFAILALVIVNSDWPKGSLEIAPTTAQLGDLLLAKYLLPFEIVSTLLLAAIVSAAELVRREVRQEEEKR